MVLDDLNFKQGSYAIRACDYNFANALARSEICFMLLSFIVWISLARKGRVCKRHFLLSKYRALHDENEICLTTRIGVSDAS